MVPTPILVVAANGTVGGHLVPLLLKRGQPVRAATRGGPHASLATGMRTVRLDLADPGTFAAALEDVAAVYLVVPGGTPDPVALLSPLVAAAAERGAKLVLQSSQGTDGGDTRQPMRRLEAQVAAAKVPWAVLRCGWFMDNFHTLWREEIVTSGALALPAAAARAAFVAASDIAAAAAVVLTERRWDGRTLTLTGPEALTFSEAMATVSRAAGRKLAYRPSEPAAFAAGLSRANLPKGYADLLSGLFAEVRAGQVAQVSDGVMAVTGSAPQKLADHAALHAKAWQHVAGS